MCKLTSGTAAAVTSFAGSFSRWKSSVVCWEKRSNPQAISRHGSSQAVGGSGLLVAGQLEARCRFRSGDLVSVGFLWVRESQVTQEAMLNSRPLSKKSLYPAMLSNGWMPVRFLPLMWM